MSRAESKACKHPPERQYMGSVRTDGLEQFIDNKNLQHYINDTMWIACCQCGAILKGVPLYDRLEEIHTAERSGVPRETISINGFTAVVHSRQNGRVHFWHGPTNKMPDLTIGNLTWLPEKTFKREVAKAQAADQT